MTTELTTGPAPAPNPPSRPATPAQLRWLREQVEEWRAEGLVDHSSAAAILARYSASRRFSIGRLLARLGAAFVGIGLIWLVAANLDRLSPLTRFLGVTVVWLALVAGVHVASERRRARGLPPQSHLVEAVGLLAALAFGGVVFQAAQALQVPAYEPALLGFWSLGALLYAYAARTYGALVVGAVTGVAWLLWHVADTAPSGLGMLLVVLAAAVLASSAAALHARFAPGGFEVAWRVVAVVLVLGSLFAAAVPDLGPGDFRATPLLVLLLLTAGATAAGTAWLGRGSTRWEPPASVLVGLVATALVLWEPSRRAGGVLDVSASDWAQSVLSVTAYLVLATWVAMLGIWRDSAAVTWLALGALTLFTVFQGFAVFAQVIDGAWLFLTTGLVLFGAGYVFDRGRRRLEAALTGPATSKGTDR